MDAAIKKNYLKKKKTNLYLRYVQMKSFLVLAKRIERCTLVLSCVVISYGSDYQPGTNWFPFVVDQLHEFRNTEESTCKRRFLISKQCFKKYFIKVKEKKSWPWLCISHLRVSHLRNSCELISPFSLKFSIKIYQTFKTILDHISNLVRNYFLLVVNQLFSRFLVM